MIALGHFLFHYRNALFPIALLLLLLPGAALFDDPLMAAMVGACSATFGQAVRIITIGLRYIIRGGRAGRIYAEDLVTDGVYALCRNPMYIGNALIVLGIAIASNSLSVLICAVPLVTIFYAAIVAAEESFLLAKFGEAYAQYLAEVPKWYPRLRDVRKALVCGSFHWRRVLMKEYGTPFGWVNALCLITLYNLARANAFDVGSTSAQVLISTMAITTALWLLVRMLKKTRRLAAD